MGKVTGKPTWQSSKGYVGGTNVLTYTCLFRAVMTMIFPSYVFGSSSDDYDFSIPCLDVDSLSGCAHSVAKTPRSGA